MDRRRNVLILKGDMAASVTLNLLDRILKAMASKGNLKETPRPCEVFSLICASGAKSPLAVLLSRGQKSTDECREILGLIKDNSESLISGNFHLAAHASRRKLRRSLTKHLAEPSQTETRCEIFAWNFHGSDEATNHVTSYRYDTTRTEQKDPSVLELLYQTLRLREYPHDAADIAEHPFHGLVTAVRTSPELHNNLACVSFRVPARDDRESESEKKALQKIGVHFHFPFVVATPHIISVTDHEMIEAAAARLASWFHQNHELSEQYESEVGVADDAI